jgi:hypothetical protein
MLSELIAWLHRPLELLLAFLAVTGLGLAIVGALRFRRRKAFASAAAAAAAREKALDDMNWREFQLLVARTFQVYEFSETEGGHLRRRISFPTRDLAIPAYRGTARDALEAMHWREFELLVAATFQLRGYEVSQTESGRDGGVDLVLRRGLDKFVVQCKGDFLTA